MFPKAYELFGNGSEFRRPGGPLDTQTFARYAMAGILIGLLLMTLINLTGLL
jgi:hypothetical protein